jgi:hypothetical protein
MQIDPGKYIAREPGTFSPAPALFGLSILVEFRSVTGLDRPHRVSYVPDMGLSMSNERLRKAGFNQLMAIWYPMEPDEVSARPLYF